MNETIDLLIRVNVLKVVWGYKKKKKKSQDFQTTPYVTIVTI